MRHIISKQVAACLGIPNQSCSIQWINPVCLAVSNSSCIFWDTHGHSKSNTSRRQQFTCIKIIQQMYRNSFQVSASCTKHIHVSLKRNMATLCKHQQAQCTIHTNSEFESEELLSAETGIQMVIMFRMIQFQSYVLKQNSIFKNVEIHSLRSGIKNIQSFRKGSSWCVSWCKSWSLRRGQYIQASTINQQNCIQLH